IVASEIPCLRARSAVCVPSSCSFNTAIICSSVNLARFICPSFFRPDSNSIWRKYAVAGQEPPTEAALLPQLAVDQGGGAAVILVGVIPLLPPLQTLALAAAGVMPLN